MTLAQDYYLDQQRLDDCAEFAESMHLAGIADGCEKRSKQCADTDYLLGYIEGLLQTCTQLQERNESLFRVLKAVMKVRTTEAELEF